MRTLTAKILAVVMLGHVAAPAVAAELPGRDEYAYSFALAVAGDSEFFTVAIPLDVYLSVVDPALRDAGVYNGDGQPVPRIFEHSTEDESGIESETALELIPLYGQQADQPDQLRFLLHEDADGTTLDLKSYNRAADNQRGEKTPSAYIVDVRELEHDLEALEFDWQTLPEGFMGRVKLEDSNDLLHWRALGMATLADLKYEEAQIVQNRVPLARKVSDFMRITWTGLPPAWRLSALTGAYINRAAPAPREWLTLSPAQAGDTDREFIFDVGGYLPADRVNVLLPEENVVVRASVFRRRDQADSWQPAYTGIFYNISRQGNALQSPAAEMRDVRAGQWKIRIDSGVTTERVRLQLGWRPDHLVFLAQGSQPFELVTGRALDAQQQYPQEAVLGDRAIFAMLRESGQAGSATIGSRAVLGGPGLLHIAPPRTWSWRVVLLWGGLVSAIFLVGALVFSLTRQMR